MRRSQRKQAEQPAKHDIIYSREVETPHVKWAEPYVNGPIRAFFVSSVHEGRTVVELMQRLTLEPRVVSVDPRWDVNKWCIDRYADFDDLVPKDYSKSYEVLEAELGSSARYDVMVMHSMLGWNDIPRKIRSMIEARVRRGEGLVLVHPHLGEDERDKGLWKLSPIIGVKPTTLDAPGAGIDEGYPKPPQEVMSGAKWEKAADHYIVDGIPFDALPYGPLKHYMYGLAKGATALATGEGGAPVVAVKEYGKGRVVGLGYHNYALFPQVEAKHGELDESFWEYLFSVLMRGMVWAAGKEPSLRLTGVEPSVKRVAADGVGGARVSIGLRNSGGAKQVRVEVAFRDERGEAEGKATRTVRLGRGRKDVVVALPKGATAGGRHLVDVMVSAGGKKQDWGTGTYEVRREARVTKVSLETDAVAAGGTLRGRARLSGKPRGMTLVAELWDQSGRLLARQEQAVRSAREMRFRVKCPEALTNVGWVKCRLMDGSRFVAEGRAEVALTAPRRNWQDYEVNVPWLHDGLWPWSSLVQGQYRRVGVTSASDPRLNFLLTTSTETPGFGVYWYRRHAYLRRKAAYGKTKDTKYLARVPCIHTEDFRGPVREAVRKRMPGMLKYSPLAYYLSDESSITCYEDAFDLCWSDATLAEFRKWLRKGYRSLSALNAEWGTRYRSWEKVMPVPSEEAKARGNPAPWVDHRLFMNKTLADGFRYAASVARRVDPKAVLTISGTQAPGSHNGCDWWQIDQVIDYLQPYSGGGQDEMHRSFNPSLILTGFTGYSLSGMPLEYEVWHRFFHGQRGASIFWGYTIVDPDLTLSAQGQTLGKVFGELRGEGLSRTVNALKREHDKIAIHFSMTSGHVWWIQDGKMKYDDMHYGRRASKGYARFMESRTNWGQVLEDLGYQYNYVSYEQIEKGEMGKLGFKALILPGSIALSEKEAKGIRAFVKGGGLLIADVEPGRTDGHGKPLAEGALADVFAAPRYGRGRAVCLDRWLDSYPQARLSAEGEQLRDTVREAMEKMRVRPRVRVAAAGGKHPLAVERVSWRSGGVEVLGLLKEMRAVFQESSDGTSGYVAQKGMTASERVRVTLPAKGHWYDLRSHAYLGEKDEVRTTLREADPKLYVKLPYRVRGVSVSVSGGGRGEVVAYEAKVKAGSARPVRHVLKIEVFGPDGEKRPLYSRNLDARAGVGKGELRLALNDARGRWRLAVTDVFSGEKAEKTWVVR